METVNEHPSVEVDVCPVFLPIALSLLIQVLQGTCHHTCRLLLSNTFVDAESHIFRDDARCCGNEGVRPRKLTPQKMIHVATTSELAGDAPWVFRSKAGSWSSHTKH